MRLFALILRDYSIEQVKKALAEHMRKSQYMPRPADIIALIDGSDDERCAEAWASVVKAISRYGRSDSVRFTDAATHYAIEQMGGWRCICETLTNSNMPFKAKDFERYYKIGERVASWTGDDGKKRVPAYFKGEHECNNARFSEYHVKIWEVETGQMLMLEEPKEKQAPNGGFYNGPQAPIAELVSSIAEETRA